jgi:glycerol-3-phosphate acyltransferase PlsX
MLDYSEYGGAPLLGVNGVAIICHGGSSPKAIKNAIRVAAQSVRSSMVEHVARELRSRQPA